MSLTSRILGWFRRDRGRMKLRYFEDVLPVEFDAVNERRQKLNAKHTDSPKRLRISRLEPKADESPKGIKTLKAASAEPRVRKSDTLRQPSPDPDKLFPRASGRKSFAATAAGGPPGGGGPPVDPKALEYFKTRPQPVPCDATGLAFSGGGIRSAAVCLGALQALHGRHGIRSIDYLSTVSGGGYIGACLSAATSEPGGGRFPFGGDISDSAAVAHLRNFSNYLLPRGRSGIRNLSEAAAIILRGLVANAILVLATLLLCALVTTVAYPETSSLFAGSFVPRLFDGLSNAYFNLANLIGGFPFSLTLWLLAAIVVVLIVWAVLRAFTRLDAVTDDTDSPLLTFARVLIITTLVVAFLDLQPVAIKIFIRAYEYVSTSSWSASLKTFFAALVALSTAISAVSSWLGAFLKTTQHATKWTTLALRATTQFAIFVAAMVLPFALWVVYLYLSALSINGWIAPTTLEFLQLKEWPVLQTVFEWPILKSIFGALQFVFGFPILEYIPGIGQFVFDFMPSRVAQLYLVAFCILGLIGYGGLRPNSYSLHRLYRDRLSEAFLFGAPQPGDVDPPPLDNLKLSGLVGSSGPYHIVNAAMNVQASAEANRRGRDADFFMFTRHFVGSDLTLYGPTKETLATTTDMETIDSRLDLATAMAISGAAVSANMGGQTVRLLSPTLALLNIRLGYWLRNPRDVGRELSILGYLKELPSRAYFLLYEMLNHIDEKNRNVYLSDGGHIENLGVYELLKRGCELIIVVDAEADPSMSFGSLLKLERYARIDLGVRISLPWEEIARRTKSFSGGLESGNEVRSQGPHCAVGRILYENGAEGIIVYFKSSLTGDEKDYILDYKKRYPAFPHETTGDQFFSEEQFEVYRALGFHIVDGFFHGKDEFSFLSSGDYAFSDREAALAAVKALLPTIV